MLISLIVATVGRREELGRLFDSLVHQELNADCFEVIVVDQNGPDFLDDIVTAYTNKLRMTHIRLDSVGLSTSRNYGLERAAGQIVGFPDDDCMYYPDTLTSVLRAFEEYPQAAAIGGRIYDFENNANVINRWKRRSFNITRLNFYYSCSSVTIFSKRTELRFSTDLGAGRAFGSCEDTDYWYQHLLLGYQLVYTPQIALWHPVPIRKHTPDAKIRAYGRGFGAFVRKRLDFYTLLLFAISVIPYGVKLISSVATFDLGATKKCWLALTARLHGVCTYDRFHS